MRLILGNSQETDKRVREDVETGDIAQIVREMNWNRDTYGRLEIDENNYLEISGNAITGFSVNYSQYGCRFLARQSPDDVEDLIDIFGKYLSENDDWKSRFEWEVANPQKNGCLAKIFMLMGLFLVVKAIFAFFIHHFFSIFKGRVRN